MTGSRDWPEGWSRDGGSSRPPASGSQLPASAPRPAASASRPESSAPRRPSGGDSERTQVLPPTTGRPASPSSYPQTEKPRRGSPPPPDFATSRSSRGGGAGRWTKRVLIALLLVLALVIVALLYFYSRIEKVDALKDYEGRPAAASGTNWLIVGSDSREGLSDQEVKDLHLGKIEGRRTDTIILLHKPDHGAPTLVSLPRDSYVPIPGHGRDKLNAAYAYGGAPLLAQTVETVTGLHLDHYAEIGFGGFVGMTDAVGGVELCPKRKIKDRKSGLDVAKGCQEMDGATALAYVRARYFDPQGDLGRVQRQQEFLGAVFDEAASPATLLNPFRILSLGNAATTALTIDEGDGPVSLVQFALTMRAVAGGGGNRITVPVADPNFRTSTGASAVRWDRDQALELFRSLAAN